MYEALVARVRYHIQKANFVGLKEAESTLLLAESADAIDAMNYELKSLYKLLGTHPDPRGENGEAGVKCMDCQQDCQMIGLDMPACTAYEPSRGKT